MSKRSESKSNVDLAELTADLKRVQADFVNFKNRVESEKSSLIDFAKIEAVRDFLNVRDNFDRAVQHLPEELAGNAWADGIVKILQQFDQVLSGLGVERFESKDQPFDPHLHEAIAVDESNVNDQKSNVEVVVEELQPGYKLADRVIRPAIVKVGRR